MALGADSKVFDKATMREIMISYTYVVIWIALSAAVILYNKWVLYFYAFPFPLALTMFHMAFCSVLAFVLVRVLKVVKPLAMTNEQYIRQVAPIGALYAVSLWFSNSAYLYLSVSFIQMLKALMPVAVYSIGIGLKKETWSSATMANMIVISIGVAIASYGEVLFDLTGFILQMGAIMAEASRLVLVQILLTSRGVTMNPITSLYYISPVCFFFLALPFAYFELPIIRADERLSFSWPIFISNASVAFFLNLAVFLLIGKTSALTMNVAGVVKDWILIGISVFMFAAPVSAINLFGYSIAFVAVGWYNYLKYLDMKSGKSKKAAEPKDEEKPLLQSNGPSGAGGSSGNVAAAAGGDKEQSSKD